MIWVLRRCGEYEDDRYVDAQMQGWPDDECAKCQVSNDDGGGRVDT